ncbi:MAG: DinB family protein, partial [Firmicutes bacterium]|nr:DinB family protein [Bacillota bacterium]
MTSELRDLGQLWSAVHESVEKMVEDLSDAEWLRKPRADFNNVASVLEHVTMVERRFLTVLDGKTPEPSTRNPFQADHWDVVAIRKAYADNLLYAQDVIARLDP